MINKVKTIFLVALLLVVSQLLAQTNILPEVKFEKQSVLKDGDQVFCRMDISLDRIYVSTNDMLVLTPVIKAADKSREVKLSSVIVTGKRRGKAFERNVVLGKLPENYMNPAAVVLRKNGKPQNINYSEVVPFEEWMNDASLFVRSQIAGCADCRKEQSERLIAQPLLYQPAFKVSYIVPEVEPVKSRSDKYTATLNFRVNKSDLDPGYMNNRAILAEADSLVLELLNNKDLTVKDFRIVGYASPESSVSHNRSLSERRANVFADYLSHKHNISRNRMAVSAYGEDWEMTRDLIVASDISDKNEILRIIDNVSNPDARDIHLKKLSEGSTYQTMLRDYYPKVRRTEYTVSYDVRSFDVEEAKKIIFKNPKLLSLNEMYLVAETYPADSKEFKQIFDIAARLYPHSEVAIINSAAANIEGDNNQGAIERMQKIAGNPKMWNNLGVAYANMGDYEKAKEYFRKAYANGDVHAKANLEELEKITVKTK